MGYILTPYRVIYESRNFVHGLTNIQAIVVKPNNDLAGPFPLVEFPAPLNGRYYFDYLTSQTDPEGEYFCAIYAANDSMNQTTQRLSIYAKPADIDVEGLEAQIALLNTLISSIAGSLTPPGISSSVSSTGITYGVKTPPDIIGVVVTEDEMSESIVTEELFRASSGEDALAYDVENNQTINYKITTEEII